MTDLNNIFSSNRIEKVGDTYVYETKHGDEHYTGVYNANGNRLLCSYETEEEANKKIEQLKDGGVFAEIGLTPNGYYGVFIKAYTPEKDEILHQQHR